MLTGRQQEIWEFLAEYVGKHGYPPTVREIGDPSGWLRPRRCTRTSRTSSGPAISGATRRSRGRSSCSATARSPRGLRRRSTSCRCSADRGGRAAARRGARRGVPRRAGAALAWRRGVPAPRQGRLDDQRGDPRRRHRRGPPQQDARNGEIVVALVGDDETANEATVKRFFREDGRIRLQPENDALEPIYAPHVQILGKVMGVFRSALMLDAAQPDARPGAPGARARGQPGVPRLRGVRPAHPAHGLVPGVRLAPAGAVESAESGLQFDVQAG